ncbi:MAG: 2-hydroxyglutaryl-CoA dehydratase [Candidatus Thorarchaeota archaeon]|nr:MAG: 2-hydroxyglutaryl-CoA dehydratase [Candidatus Thorarchaeota archaeon]
MSEFGIGIDVGSTTAKGILIDSEHKVRAKHIMSTGATASKAIDEILKELESQSGYQIDSIPKVGTGYGRARIEDAKKTVTEITCHSIGVHSLNPEIRLLIDVGGQDAKVIRIGKDGRPEDFEINDKCSAGTGRFLEVMARVLGVTLDELGPLALQSKSPSSISNTCTVFAESEVIGHIGAGVKPADIAAGIHESMTTKIGALARRVKVVPPVCVTGGVALNPAFRYYLSKHLGTELWIPKEPQLTGALGAAVEALRL